jgi:membrane protease YdiL (CAAX protease family)
MTDSKNRALVIGGGILLTLALLVAALFSGSFFPTESLVSKFLLTRIFSWLALLIVMAYAVKVEKRPFLVLQEQTYKLGKSLLLALGVVAVVAVGAIAISVILKSLGFSAQSAQAEKIIQVIASNIWLLIFTCVTAGVTEELLFRGYLFSRLALLFRSSWLAVVVSSLLFAAFHAGFGTLVQFLNPLYIGLIFTLFYRKYSNIKIPIIIHIIIDLSSLLPLYFHQ